MDKHARVTTAITYVHACMYVCMHACMHAWLHAKIYTTIYTYMLRPKMKSECVCKHDLVSADESSCLSRM